MILWPWSEYPIFLNMEETFIATGILIVVLGVILGILVTWAFGKDVE